MIARKLAGDVVERHPALPFALRRLGQPLGKRVRPFGRVARAETDDDVARPRLAAGLRHQVASDHRQLRTDRVSMRSDAIGERAVIDARNRTFARRIERRDDDVIGVFEARANSSKRSRTRV